MRLLSQTTTDLMEACPPDEEAGGDVALDHIEPLDCSGYDPLPHQRAFHESDAPYKAAIGGLGFGKTVMGTMEALYHVWQYLGDTPHVGIVGACTYPMIRDVLLPAFMALFPPGLLRGGSWDKAFIKSEMTLYVLQSKILFRSLDGGRHNRLRGVEDCAWFWPDEACQLQTRDPWEVGCARVRHKTARIKTRWITTTPRGEDWVAEDFILRPKPGHVAIRGRTMDNHHLPVDYIEHLRQTLSPRQFDQEALGLIVSPEGAVYQELSRQAWPAGNVIELERDDRIPYRLAVDFGRNHPRAVVLQKRRVENPGRRGFLDLDVVVAEWAERDGSPPADHLIEDMAEGVKRLGYPIRVIHGDPAGDSRNDHEHLTSARKLAMALGAAFLPPPTTMRSKVRGEELVASRIMSADGLRRLVWLSRGDMDRAGGLKAVAENNLQAHLRLSFPKRKTGKAAPNESLKDGVNDHDTDAVRYDQVSEHGFLDTLRGGLSTGSVAGAA